MEKYQPTKIEAKWQEVWGKAGLYKPDLDHARKPFYNLMMFPYPSAEGLHVGNMYAFTGSDIYGRFKRMQGFDVFEPIGLDGFGIHSENYAIKVGRHPKEQANVSEKNFYRQLRATGNAYDWSRTVETYDPDYYKWTQWIFIQLFKKGLAYRKKASVNFCPSCKTVLADEQVIDARCERCHSLVNKREFEQWFFKITDYADRLLDGLSQIDWSEKIKVAQRNWIGRKEGMDIEFLILPISNQPIKVYTVFPETIFGVTYMVLAPEHPFVASLLNPKLKEVRAYVEKASRKTEQERIAEGKEKTGIFTGSYCINPVNGEKVPIWVADYVIAWYGTGAVMGVPGSDQRDFAFAKKYKLPIRRVIARTKGDVSEITSEDQVLEEGFLVNSLQFSGLSTPNPAKERIKDWFEEKGWGKRKTTYHLRDWLISRQRYWGPPIPMINCEKCGWQPVPEKDLPVLLPDVKDWRPKGTGQSPLASVPSFVNTNCPRCKGKAQRETDVSDTFLDSAWYFLRYISTEFKEQPFDKLRARKWLPVNVYIGGAEHAVLHLLYTRFLTMAFKDMGLIAFEEPFKKFYAHGLLISEGAKMSKSRGNVVIPDSYIKKYGVDTLRCYLMFLGPFSQGGDFRDTGIEGMYKFLKRVWKLVARGPVAGFPSTPVKQASSSLRSSAPPVQALPAPFDGVGNPSTRTTPRSAQSSRMMHKTLKGVTEDLEGLRFNTAIAKLMEFVNHLQKQTNVSNEELKVLLLLMAPFTPFLAEELWEHMNQRFSVHAQPWPKYNPKLIEEKEVTIVVQINGKVRDNFQFPVSTFKLARRVEEEALKREKVKKYLKDKVIEKVIYVPGKIISFVVQDSS